jgi:type II secretory pathway component PulC
MLRSLYLPICGLALCFLITPVVACTYAKSEFAPERKHGKLVGMRILPLTKKSYLWYFGLRSNDILLSLDRIPLNDTEQMLNLWKKLSHRALSEAQLIRNGKRFTAKFKIQQDLPAALAAVP